MKVAIIHDYIKEYGGAERVLEALIDIYPNATIFTTVFLPYFLGPHTKRFQNLKIVTSFLQQIPFNDKLISPARLIAPFIFKGLDFSKYDVVIVSQTGAYTPNFIDKKNAVQICYTHTPPRYLYGYATAREWKRNSVFRVMGEISNHILRIVDFKSSENVDYFIANSENVRKRIQKFYRKDARIIYPPVDLQDSNPVSKSNYFLAGGRIAKPKHVDLIVKAFEKLNLPLKVFGRTFVNGEVKSSKDNIERLGEVSDEEKIELMRNARAYVFASEDEDFGIIPVEAQAAGTPVIAYRSGGVVESVIDGKTGLFFDNLSISSLSEAVKKFNKMKFNNDIIKKQAQKFSKERFKKDIGEFVSKHT